MINRYYEKYGEFYTPHDEIMTNEDIIDALNMSNTIISESDFTIEDLKDEIEELKVKVKELEEENEKYNLLVKMTEDRLHALLVYKLNFDTDEAQEIINEILTEEIKNDRKRIIKRK